MATTTSTTAKSSGGTSADLTPDEQLDHIVHKLTKVPAHLQHANPKTYKNYKKELDKHLGDVKVVNAESITGISPAKIHAGGGGGGRGVQPMFGFWSCMLSVGQIIVEYGISIFKVVSWIRKARARSAKKWSMSSRHYWELTAWSRAASSRIPHIKIYRGQR